MNNIYIYIDIANKNVAIFSIFFVEGPPLLKRYLSYVKKLGWCVGMIWADRGSEYFGMDGEHVQKDSENTFTDFERVAEEQGVVVEAAPRGGSTGSGLVERYHRIIFEIGTLIHVQYTFLAITHNSS